MAKFSGKIFLFLLLSSLIGLSPVVAKEVVKKTEIKKEVITTEKLPESLSEKTTVETKQVFYELIQDNLKPEPDEFYLSMIFGTQENPKALIKRSTNSRASEVYSEAIPYGIGDHLTDDLIIDAIDFKTKEVVVKKMSTDDYYSLLLTYGSATSRLTKKQNYKR